MSKQTYYEKLQHPLWQQRRLKIMQNAEFKCQSCGSADKQLNVHHLYYITNRDPWQYPDWALKCLCKDCHSSAHNEFRDAHGHVILEPFEEMLSWLEGSNDEDFLTLDISIPFGMLRNSKPDKINEFITEVLHFAYETRLRMQSE